MTYMSGKIAVTSSYSNGVLSGISRGGYNNGTSFTQTYGFNHDAWGNTTAELVGNQVVASYTFGNGNGNLLRITYSNGNTVDYTYDNLDRVKTVSYNNVPKYSYYYDGSGALSRTVEHDTDTVIYYQYDGIGRLVSQLCYYLSTNVPKKIDAEYFTYDAYNRDSKVITEADYKTNIATYTYNNNTGDIDYLYNKYDVNTATNGDKLTYTYDTLNRLSQKRLEHHANTAATLDTRYTYKTISGNRTSNQISELKYVIGNSSSYWNKYNYTYDQAGNIKQTSTGQGDNVVKYFYDAQGQLVMEENNTLNKTYAYTYDTCGNIRQKRIYDVTGFTSETDLSYAMPTETINYSYTDANFKDQLTNYNGTNINYDNIGNPLNWTGGATLTWQNGRELANYSKSGTSISYTYNGDGLRSSKTVNGTKYTYIYNGSLPAMQKWGNKPLRFIYDNNGSPYAVVYNNGSTDTVYYYIKNQQGDVTMIVDQNIGIVAKYTYDAWGKLLSVTNASGTTLTSGIGIDNPIRYRSYVYDDETGWYYLNSRYYDPSVCRFI